MKKILLITMLLVLVAVPAFAGGINFSTFAVSATSKAGVSSMSFGNSGSGAAALNTSYAGVSFSGNVSGMATQNPQSLKKVRERQGPGFWGADIGESETVGRDRTYKGSDGGDVSVNK